MIRGIPVNASNIPEANLVSFNGIRLIIPRYSKPIINPIAMTAPDTALAISIRLNVASATEFSTASSIAMYR